MGLLGKYDGMIRNGNRTERAFVKKNEALYIVGGIPFRSNRPLERPCKIGSLLYFNLMAFGDKSTLRTLLSIWKVHVLFLKKELKSLSI